VLSIHDVTIDDELEALLPPLSSEEIAGLISSVKRDGFTDPIIVWLGHGILVDGHNRHRVWREELGGDEDKAPEIIERQFASRDDVKEWMLRRQLSRRNLTDAMRVKVALQLRPMIEARAKANQIRKPSGSVPLTSAEQPMETRKEIAKAAGVGADTVRKVESVLRDASESIKAAMLNGDQSINAAFNETRHAAAATQSPKVERYGSGLASLPTVRDHAPEDDDPADLASLMYYWKRATKKSRKLFLSRIKESMQ